MDINAVTLIIGAIGGAIATILGVIFTKGRLAEVITGHNTRQNTAVDTIAEMLENAIAGWLAGAQAIAMMTEQNERRLRNNVSYVAMNTQQHSELDASISEMLDAVQRVADRQDECLRVLRREDK